MSFNPYSIGSYSGSLEKYQALECFQKVSILILLEVTLEVLFLAYSYFLPLKFQSLFYWKLLWKFIINVSNPISCNVSILILLEVTLEVYSSFSSKFLNSIGFNPYSIGSYSGSCQSRRDGLRLRIVSILILLEVTLEEVP